MTTVEGAATQKSLPAVSTSDVRWFELSVLRVPGLPDFSPSSSRSSVADRTRANERSLAVRID